MTYCIMCGATAHLVWLDPENGNGYACILCGHTFRIKEAEVVYH